MDEPPGHGTAEAGAGGIAYTPEPGYTGPDTVGFQVVGAGGTAVGAAHLVISVVPAAGGPRASTTGGHLRGSGGRD